MAVIWSTNCPTRISSREKMTEEVFFMTIFTKVIWPAGYGYKLRYRTRLILDSAARFTNQDYFLVNVGLVL